MKFMEFPYEQKRKRLKEAPEQIKELMGSERLSDMLNTIIRNNKLQPEQAKAVGRSEEHTSELQSH